MQTPSISRCRENGIFSQRTQTTTYASGSRDQERTPGDCRQLDFIVKQSSASPRVKWIVSSRNWPHIEKKFKTAAQGVWLRLELNENSISAAVTSYIQAKVDQLAGENKYDDDTRDTVQHYLLSNANGTFLWVALVYQELAKISRISRQRIQERLAAFPPGLDCLYSRMMDHILSSDDAELCKRILAVVSLVYRPVTLDELVSLIDMLDDDDDVSVDDEALPKIIGLCGSFLTLRERTIFFVHQSAKDFLVDKRKGYGEIYPSGIEYVHLTVFSRSLQVMSERLKRNIYSQDKLGIFVDQVKQPDPDPLSPARYSCVHWIDHLLDCDPARNATSNLQDGGLIDKFLRQKFLYWLEALSLCKSMSKGVHAMAKLEAVIQGIADAPALHELVRDACRFILSHKWAIQNNPLQAYVSALVFSPTCSLIRGLFKKEEPDWITIKPGIGDQWSACLQTLEGHRGSVRSVAFSHDSTRLASASHDSTVKIWDTSSGECLQTLEGHRDWVYSVAFSHDSTRLASASNDSTVEIWDTSGGECLQTLEGHRGSVRSVAFSHNSTRLASASHDSTVKIWDTSGGECLQTLEGHRGSVNSVAFSHDSTRLASAAFDSTVKIWDTSSGECLQTLEGHRGSVYSVAFSHDSTRLASAAFDSTVKIWDTSGGECLQTLEVGRLLNRISFDITDSYLHTEIGTIDISAQSGSNTLPTISEPLNPKYQSLALSSDSVWITCDSENLVWLPSEYRLSCSAVSEKMIGVGVGTGRVWICKV